MNVLDRAKQIVAALTEGLGVRATARLTGANRETVGKLGVGCAELHDRIMTGTQLTGSSWTNCGASSGKSRPASKGMNSLPRVTSTFSLAWRALRRPSFLTLSASGMARIVTFLSKTFASVLGFPEISTDGWHSYRTAIRDAFGNRVAHGVVSKPLLAGLGNRCRP
jgi:hypothetical protein